MPDVDPALWRQAEHMAHLQRVWASHLLMDFLILLHSEGGDTTKPLAIPPMPTWPTATEEPHQ